MKKIFWLFVMSLALIACTGGGGGGGSSDSDSDSTEQEAISFSQIVTELETNSHTDECFERGDEYWTESIEIENSQLVVTTDFYRDDSTCSTLLVTLTTTMDYEEGDAFGSDGNAYEVDFTVKSATVDVITDSSEVISVMNSANSGAGYCDKTDWAIGDSDIDVIGTDACGVSYDQDEVIYDIIRYNNDTVQVGNRSGSTDGTSAANRPTTYSDLEFEEDED